MASHWFHGKVASRYTGTSLLHAHWNISYIDRASHEAGAAAEMAASRKEDLVDLGARYIFEPIAVETLGVFNASARHLLGDLGRRISINTGEPRETSYLFQRISVLVHRFNAVLLHDSLPAADSTD